MHFLKRESQTSRISNGYLNLLQVKKEAEFHQFSLFFYLVVDLLLLKQVFHFRCRSASPDSELSIYVKNCLLSCFSESRNKACLMKNCCFRRSSKTGGNKWKMLLREKQHNVSFFTQKPSSKYTQSPVPQALQWHCPDRILG